MKEIVIEKVKKEKYQYLIFCTTVDSPFSQLEKISKKIEGSECIVLFDLLLQTGDNDNRFFLVTFNKRNFDINTAKKINKKIVDNDTLKIVADFLRSNEKILEYCILFSDQKERIKSGGII